MTSQGNIWIDLALKANTECKNNVINTATISEDLGDDCSKLGLGLQSEVSNEGISQMKGLMHFHSQCPKFINSCNFLINSLYGWQHCP